MEPGSPSKMRPDVKRSGGVSVEMRTVSSVSKAAYLVLAVALFGVAPTQVAVQDAGSLAGRAPAMADRIRAHLFASPFCAISRRPLHFPAAARIRHAGSARVPAGEPCSRRFGFHRLDRH